MRSFVGVLFHPQLVAHSTSDSMVKNVKRGQKHVHRIDRTTTLIFNRERPVMMMTQLRCSCSQKKRRSRKTFSFNKLNISSSLSHAISSSPLTLSIMWWLIWFLVTHRKLGSNVCARCIRKYTKAHRNNNNNKKPKVIDNNNGWMSLGALARIREHSHTHWILRNHFAMLVFDSTKFFFCGSRRSRCVLSYYNFAEAITHTAHTIKMLLLQTMRHRRHIYAHTTHTFTVHARVAKNKIKIAPIIVIIICRK